MTLRVTRPCGRCQHEAECAPFLGALCMLVADHDQRAQYPLPDVCVECLLFLPKRCLPLRPHREQSHHFAAAISSSPSCVAIHGPSGSFAGSMISVVVPVRESTLSPRSPCQT